MTKGLHPGVVLTLSIATEQFATTDSLWAGNKCFHAESARKVPRTNGRGKQECPQPNATRFH
jgi:hypothetical protein